MRIIAFIFLAIYVVGLMISVLPFAVHPSALLVFLTGITALLATFSLVKNKKYRIISSAVLGIVLSLILCSYDSSASFGDFLGFLVFFACPILLSCWLVFHRIERKRQEKRAARIRELIHDSEAKIPDIKTRYISRKIVLNLTELLSLCGSDMENIESCPELSSAAQLKLELDREKVKIERLNAELNAMQ